MNKLKIARVLLLAAILMIVVFQGYWLNRLYKDEWQGLKKETNGIFRDVIYNVQLQRFTRDTITGEATVSAKNLFAHTAVNVLRSKSESLSVKNVRLVVDSTTGDSLEQQGRRKAMAEIAAALAQVKDSTPVSVQRFTFSSEVPPELAARIAARRQINHVQLPPLMDSATLGRMAEEGVKVVVSLKKNDTATFQRSGNVITVNNILVGKPKARQISRVETKSFVAKAKPGVILATTRLRDNPFVQLISNGRVIDDTIPVAKLDSAYKKELTRAGIPLPFYIKKGKDDSTHWKDTIPSVVFSTSTAGAGLIHPYWYQAGFQDPTGFLLRKISLQILFSVFLVAFTSLAFNFLYRNLVAQRKLAEMKNDFISNITHELKTPLATVSVAVEALRSFGGINNPERAKEYLDISASELQRLSLLVDKVLKLSLFENKELELKKVQLDLRPLTEEVVNTMKLQFDTHKADVQLEVEGETFQLYADRLHITSVVFNLLDNALKYSKEKPKIQIRLVRETNGVVLQVADNGIGISHDYQSKIFDKFFRVPTGDHHNIKGYGLGLSYVAHVVRMHGGTIAVSSEPGEGSVFTVKFPTT